jgi:Asp-tRNA(Asn)/Glu-tRNA(Gln) amidotransferase A subunit family amidase
VEDLAKLLDVMVGYDPEDPLTAYGVSHIPRTYTNFLVKDGLKGARIGVIRESIGTNADPAADDFKRVDEAFAKAVSELQAAGAVIVDNIVIPDVKALLARRANAPDSDEATAVYFARNAADAPYRDHASMYTPANIAKVSPTKHLERSEGRRESAAQLQQKHYESLLARKQLMTNLMKVMADNNLDAIVHKTVEHEPNRIADATKPPYPGTKGVIHMNTFLEFLSSMTVPAGMTSTGLPTGITFVGREYEEPTLIRLAYAYEQATHHRAPPASTPALKP